MATRRLREVGRFQRLWTRRTKLLVAGHGMKILNDCLDVFLRQRIEVGHPGSSSNTSGVCDEEAEEARVPVFRYAARRIQFRTECPSNAIDGVTFQAMRNEQLLTGLRAIGTQAR